MGMTKLLSLLLALLLLPFSQFLLMPPAAAVSPNIVISEVVPDGSSATQEFVELYNNSTADVSLEGWTIQLRSATGAINRTLTLDNVLRGHDYALLASTAYTAPCAAADFPCFTANMSAAGGHVLLIDNTGATVDKLGWGTANAAEGTAALVPAFFMASLNRKSASIGVLQDTDSNFDDFVSGVHTATGGGVYELPPPVIDVCLNLEGVQETLPVGYELVAGNCQVIVGSEPEIAPNCQGVSISEILPNPAGDDGGQEYIELFNETSALVDLTGCILKVGSQQQVLSGSIEPGYKVFYGLTLPNSAGGQVMFITNTYAVSVTYPANMGDDQAYGYIDGEWQDGLTPTPGAANVLPADTPTDNSDSGEELASCGPGKYRSPETNRCRNASTAALTLVACGPGETRNPETNRCKKTTSSASTLTPCQPGQERSPETNRCRKVASAKTTNPLSNPASTAKKPVSYYVIAVVAALAVAYAIFEYRSQIRNFVVRLRRKPESSYNDK